MKILIIGSGLMGVTTAYLLSESGHEVTVLDRGTGPARETSFANAALLTPSMSDPWNAPGCWRLLLASFGRSDTAFKLDLRALPSLMGWGVTFLRNSRKATFQRNSLINLRLALKSLEEMDSIARQTGIEYERMTVGTLRIFRELRVLERATVDANRLQCPGLRVRRLSIRETVELEPALAPIARQLTGAIQCETDVTGDAYRFCVALASHAQQKGVQFRFRTEVSSLEVRSNRLTAAVSDGERLVADRYIVAAGSYSTPLLRRVGVHLPVRPVKGYSVTLESHQHPQALNIPIIDDQLHAVITPLKGRVRVAGAAEFVGYDRAINPARIRSLLALLHEVLPQGQFDLATATPWSGLRPMSVDGIPIIGPTRIQNLFVNTGHGHLGWTMAAGSARLLADLICQRAPRIDPAPYDMKRFG